jgi:hypothetical protein
MINPRSHGARPVQYNRTTIYMTVYDSKCYFIGATTVEDIASEIGNQRSAARRGTRPADRRELYDAMMKYGPDKFGGYRIDVLDTKTPRGKQEALEKWRKMNPPAPLKCRYDGKDPRADKYCCVCGEQYYDASFYLNHMRIEHRDIPMADSVSFPALTKDEKWIAMQAERKTFTQLGVNIPFWLQKWYEVAPMAPVAPVAAAAKRGDNVDAPKDERKEERKEDGGLGGGLG